MRIFTLVCALMLVGVGAVSYYGWEDRGEVGPTLSSAVPAFVGGIMLFGVLVALLLRKTGLQIAFLASLMGLGLGVGRMLPDYLKETFDTKEPFTILMLAMAGTCALHVLVSVLRFVFRKRPVRGEGKKKRNRGDVAEKTKTEVEVIEENSNAVA
jgi:hypothetical protein